MPSGALDEVDARILDQLQRDAKFTNVELAARVHLSPSPCLARVRRLERAGVVSRYVALLDPERVGLPVSAVLYAGNSRLCWGSTTSSRVRPVLRLKR